MSAEKRKRVKQGKFVCIIMKGRGFRRNVSAEEREEVKGKEKICMCICY